MSPSQPYTLSLHDALPISILDPELVILSGPLAQVGQPLLDALDRALAAQPLVPPALQISALGRDAVVHGALRHSLDLVEAREIGRASCGKEGRSRGGGEDASKDEVRG